MVENDRFDEIVYLIKRLSYFDEAFIPTFFLKQIDGKNYKFRVRFGFVSILKVNNYYCIERQFQPLMCNKVHT